MADTNTNDDKGVAEETESNMGGGDHRTALGTAAYTFYLNLVVIENVVVPTSNNDKAASGSSTPTPRSESPPPAQEQEETEETKTAEAKKGEGKEQQQEEGGADASSSENNNKNKLVNIQSLPFYTMKGMNMNMKMKSMKLDESLYSFSKAMSKTSQAMSKTSQAMSKTAEGVSQRAAAFVASKTMVSRASAALDKSLDELQSNENSKLDVTLGKRFQQGNVIVVQVHLKASDLPVYISQVRGDEAAQHYRSALVSLQALNALDTLARLEQEMLPQIRNDLMEHFADKLSTAMKEKDSSLVFQCIPLEESEEAHWLFTFMEFQAQMKHEAKTKKDNFRITPLRNEAL